MVDCWRIEMLYGMVGWVGPRDHVPWCQSRSPTVIGKFEGNGVEPQSPHPLANKKLPYSTNKYGCHQWIARWLSRFIYFLYFCYFVHVACMTTLLKSKWKLITKYFLIVANNISLLADIYAGDDLTANRQLQMLLLLWLDIVHLENI